MTAILQRPGVTTRSRGLCSNCKELERVKKPSRPARKTSLVDTTSQPNKHLTNTNMATPQSTSSSTSHSQGFTADQLDQFLQTLSSSLAASNQATTTQLSALTQALAQGQNHSSGGYSARPPTFHGDGVENVDQFLASFTRHADFFNWSSAKRFQALTLSLVGPANIWFTSLDPSSYTSFDDLSRLLREQFNSPASLWLARQQLNQRKMSHNESVASYSADIRRQCQLLRIPKSEWTHIYVTGLRPDIRSHLVLQQPSSFEEAEQQATLKEAVAQPEPSGNSADQLAQALLARMQAKPVNSSPQSHTVAAVTTSTDSQSLHDVITELRDAVRELSSNARQSRNRGNRYNGRNNNYNNRQRNRRTQDGSPICNTCNRPGHMSYNCPTLATGLPAPDPRIPQGSQANQGRQNQQPNQPHQGNM